MTTIPRSVIFALSLLVGCQAAPSREPLREVEIVEVRVPVPTMPEPPAELAQQFRPGMLPEFVPPTDPGATSALTQEGERRLKELLLDLRNRDEAWREWAGEPAQ